MKDSIVYRKAKIGASEQDLTDNDDITLNIIVNTFRPLVGGFIVNRLFDVNIGNTYGRVDTIENSVTKDASTNTNVLMKEDPDDDDDRFVFIGQVIGPVTKYVRDFYFDTKYGDILSVPEIASITTKNSSLTIVCEAYGYSNTSSEEQLSSFSLPYPDINVRNPSFEKTTVIRSTSVDLITTFVAGLNMPRLINETKLVLPGYSIGSDYLLPLYLAKFNFPTPISGVGMSYALNQVSPGVSSLMLNERLNDMNSVILPIVN